MEIQVKKFLWKPEKREKCGNQSRFHHINSIAASNRTTTSQIRSHVEYLIQTYNILALILYSKLMKHLASLTFLPRINDDFW